jgi:hypothetical protein
MSTFVLARSRPAQLLGTGSPAHGVEFLQIRELLNEIKSDRRSAASAPQSVTLAELARVAKACSQRGWDGYDAQPISPQTQRNARAFLEDLPMWLQAPDIVPEPDGEIAIEWDLGPGRIFSVSIGDTGKLHYAGLFKDGVERHGVEPFEGVVSTEVLGYAKRLLDAANPVERRRTA